MLFLGFAFFAAVRQKPCLIEILKVKWFPVVFARRGFFMGSLIKKRRKKMRKHKYKKYGRKMRARK